MTTETMLKEYILSNYKSVREFCMLNDFPYSTVNNIFNRGLMGSSLSIVMRVCDRLGIDIDELANGTIVEKTISNIELTKHEIRLVTYYRNNPEMQPAVDRLLKIDDSDTVTVFRAAHSTDNHAPEITRVSRDLIQKLDDAPETDEKL